MAADPVTCLINENAEDETESNSEDASHKTNASSTVIMENITGADEPTGGEVEGDEQVGEVEMEGQSAVEDELSTRGSKVSLQNDKERKVEEEEREGGGEEQEKVCVMEGARVDESERDKDPLSDVNLASPPSDQQGLEFFDHNITSSDSSDARVRSVRPGVEELPAAEEYRERGEIVKHKPGWDRQRESAKLLDFESPVDARREVSEEEVEDYRDLKATITHREKQGSRSDSYINYRVVTETTRPSHLYEETHYEVWRRYRDFEWLRTQIERTHPTLILPPLPGKQVARYFDHMSETFLEERQRALGKFLWRLTVHPYFSFSTDLKAFLTASPEDFTAHVQESQGRQKLMGRLSSSVRQAQTALMLKDADPEFAKQLTYFSDLGDKMAVLERIGARLHSERESLQAAHEDFSVELFHWATNEQVMAQPLHKLANCVEKCGHLIKSLSDANTYSMMVAVKEYQLYSTSAVAAIRRRDALQLEVERSGFDREKKKRHHEEATASGKVQRVIKLADDLEKVGLAAEKAQDHLSQANEQLRVDMEKWHGAKNKEICQLMRQFATNHMNYHQKCFSEWEAALKQLRSDSTSPSSATHRGHLAALMTSSRDSDDVQSDS